MVPLLSMILLGLEGGLSLSTAQHIFGSYRVGLIAVTPHGIVEIPAIALAGALTYSAHLAIQEAAWFRQTEAVFGMLADYRKALPVRGVALMVAGLLLLAGLIEAHITDRLIEWALLFTDPGT
jgi:uncharacterized membrane protein SpoIIM required for sporulation